MPQTSKVNSKHDFGIIALDLIETLDVSNRKMNQWDDDTFRIFCKSLTKMRNLREINLMCNGLGNLSNDLLRILFIALRDCPKLQVIKLGWNGFNENSFLIFGNIFKDARNAYSIAIHSTCIYYENLQEFIDTVPGVVDLPGYITSQEHHLSLTRNYLNKISELSANTYKTITQSVEDCFKQDNIYDYKVTVLIAEYGFELNLDDIPMLAYPYTSKRKIQAAAEKGYIEAEEAFEKRNPCKEKPLPVKSETSKNQIYWLCKIFNSLCFRQKSKLPAHYQERGQKEKITRIGLS